VVRAARRHFGLDDLGIELRTTDAREYLDAETRRFDLIVEDLFVGAVRTVRKPDWLVPEGYRGIRRRLRRGGIVSTNSIHESPAIIEVMRSFGGRVVSLDVRGHWNRILVCGADLPAPRALRSELAGHAELARVLGFVAVRSPRPSPIPSTSLPRERAS